MGISFLKRGKEAQEALAKADAEAEVRAKQRGVRRFWVPKEGESTVTFLDGALNSDGILDMVTFNEHRVLANGTWRNYFPCTAATEPCPLCEQGAPKASVSLFTVIDHTKWKDRNQKTHINERKLFVAKRDTVKRLQKMAAKRGGLVGWRVSIGRVGERSPEVGTDFDFMERQDLSELMAQLKLKPEDMKPFDYDAVMPYFTADELRELGFGSAVVGQYDTQKLKTGKKKKKPVVEDDDDDDAFDDDTEDDDDDDAPSKKAKAKAKTKKPVDDDDDDDDTDDADDSEDEDEDDAPPPPKKKKVVAVPASVKKKKKPVVEDDDDDDL